MKLLGLNEDGKNVSRRSVEMNYKLRAVQTHPDKQDPDLYAQDPKLYAEKSAEFRAVSDAKDHLLTIFQQ